MKPEEKPWLRIPADFVESEQIRQLSTELKCSVDHAAGMVISFWGYTLRENIVLLSHSMAKTLFKEEVLNAFVSCRFLVPSQTVQSYILADWPVFAFPWALNRERAKIRKEQATARQRKRRAKSGGSNVVREEGRNPYKYKHQGLRKAPVRVRERMEKEMGNT